MSKQNTLQHVFTFEDLYKDTDEENAVVFPVNDKKFELGSFNQDNQNLNLNGSKSFDDYDHKKKIIKKFKI